MKKIFTTAFIFVAAITSSYAQKCGTDEVMKREIAKNPAIAAEIEEFERGFAEWKANKPAIGFREGEKYIIPVVFHVIHEGGAENISKAQILDQMEILNRDFNHENADSVNTPQPFLDVAGALDVEFRLARIDPAGNCTEGITRTFSNKTNSASNVNGLKELIDWNCYSYLNVWVVKSIENFTEFGTILGYAQFPASGLCGTDGVVMLHTMTGSIGTAASAEGRTLVHEVGHWLSLIHIWGDADCGSDQVNDTPAAFGPNFGICYDDYPYFPADTCDNTNPYGEMMVNYMDYSNDECMNMFTEGQVERMEYVLGGTTGNNGVRSYLWSDQNLLATGTNDDFNGGPCAPIADFTANKYFACTGVSVTFSDESYNGSITGRDWTFTGGNPATSTQTNPSVTYDSPGVYPVTLTASNNVGSDTETKTSYIHISGTSATQVATYTYLSDFENIDQFNNDWTVINPDNTANKWEIAGGLYTPSGGGAVRVNNYNNTPTEYDELISPSFDLSNLQDPVIISYNYSGATRTLVGTHDEDFTVYGDDFKVAYSTNCGQSWVNIPQLALADDAVNNAGLYTDFYVPNSESIWTYKQFTLPSAAANNDNVRFKFSYTAGGSQFGSSAGQAYGNNFYLDGIRIENTTGVDNLKNALGVQVFPNPTDGITRISLNTPESGKLTLSLIDMLGREIAGIYSGSVGSGEQVYNVDVNNLDAGIYMLRINYNDKTSSLKLMVK